MAGGTATYLGYYGGSYWALTANHVANGNITFAGTGTYSVLSSETICNCELEDFPGAEPKTAYADIKLLQISGDANLEALGNIYLNTDRSLITLGTTDLYAVGTGVSTTIGGTINAGSRQKQWAVFQPDLEFISNVNFQGQQYASRFFEELLRTNSNTSFHGALYDSGSGIFMYHEGEWYLTAIMNMIGDNDGNGLVSNGDSTLMLDLSYYGSHIHNVMGVNIPEPSTYTFLFTLSALIFRFAQRRKVQR